MAYQIKNNQVYYKGELLKKADSKSFKVIGNYTYEYDDPSMPFIDGAYITDEAHVAKDKNHVYLGPHIWKGKDAATYQFFYPYSKDKNHVWYQNTWSNIESVLAEADPVTFTPLPTPGKEGSSYAKDAKNIFFAGWILEGRDLNSFEVINEHYTKDKNHVYLQNNMIEGADPQSFQFIGKISLGTASHPINCYYGRDKSHFFIDRNQIKVKGNPANFSIKYSYYLGNEEQVYYKNQLVEGLNIDFTAIHSTRREYLISDSKIFYRTEDNQHFIIENADVDSFEVLWRTNTDYAKDKNQVYYKGLVLALADAQSFKMLYAQLGKDRDRVYFEGRLIPKAHAPSFSHIKYGYTKDKNHVYYKGQLVKNADPETFEVIQFARGKDKFHFYDENNRVED